MNRNITIGIAILVAGAILTPTSGCDIEDGGVLESDLEEVKERLYVDATKLWPTMPISVCWEKPTAGDLTEREWVRDAVTTTWDKMSGVQFTGWGACVQGQKGVRVQIADVGPHTSGLGTALDGVTNGMVLNFTFNNWSTSCKDKREFCVRTIAVHEFGHALGFAHEQNRPDSPNTCTAEKQGSNGNYMVDPWDIHSVMNYCNPDWNGDGKLSDSDIHGVQEMYGLEGTIGNFWDSPNMGQGAGAQAWLTGDIDGDKRTDIFQPWDNGGKLGLIVYRSTGKGYVFSWGTSDTGQPSAALAWRTGDVNGDGRTDLIQIKNNGGKLGLVVYASTGTGLQKSWGSENMGQGSGALDWLVADVTGDGRSDLVQPWSNGGKLGLILYRSTGTGFAGAWGSSDMGQGSGALGWLAGDVTGDGRADLVQPWNNGGNLGLIVYRSTGNGFEFSWGTPNTGRTASAVAWRSGDINGDGKMDLIQPYSNGGKLGFVTYRSTGAGLTYHWGTSNIGQGSGALAWLTADFNGDGKTDLLQPWNNNGELGLIAYPSLGSSYATQWGTSDMGQGASAMAWLTGDVNGDGRTDLIQPYNNGGKLGILTYVSGL